MGYFYLSAAHKSSGKTTLSIGLCAAFSGEHGLTVQPFKKGPDYIDPLWLAAAAGRPCFNLDVFMESPEANRRLFQRHMPGADIGIIEGNKGLFDGISTDGSDSNAAMAGLLGAPVILVIDTRGMTRGIAPLLHGYATFDTEVGIAGVILNQVGGARHEAKLHPLHVGDTCLERGADDFVNLPCGTRELSEVLVRHLHTDVDTVLKVTIIGEE